MTFICRLRRLVSFVIKDFLYKVYEIRICLHYWFASCTYATDMPAIRHLPRRKFDNCCILWKLLPYVLAEGTYGTISKPDICFNKKKSAFPFAQDVTNFISISAMSIHLPCLCLSVYAKMYFVILLGFAPEQLTSCRPKLCLTVVQLMRTFIGIQFLFKIFIQFSVVDGLSI